jgi:hypothetical protein
MNTILLQCQNCRLRVPLTAPTPQRGWDLAMAHGWAKNGLNQLVCPAENPARIEFLRSAHA